MNTNTKTKTNNNSPLGGQGASTAAQRKEIHLLCDCNTEIKEALVHQYSNGRTTTSTELTLDEASRLISSLKSHWARFKKSKRQHMYIVSLLRQLGWTQHNERYGIIADMDRLSDFLKSTRSPVRKPLQDMNTQELSTLINCLESMLGKKFNTK